MEDEDIKAFSRLYLDLHKCEVNADYENAVKICEKILKKWPEEEKAYHCKIVSFIQLSKFKEAYTECEKNKNSSLDLTFEKAYCLYRLNDSAKAFQVVKSCPNSSPQLKDLEAQILYRLERYEECFKIYREIIKNADDEYGHERSTNISAVVSNIASTINKKEMPVLNENTYELLYNGACGDIANGHYEKAHKKLLIAEDMCRKTLEDDDVPEEDIVDELYIIRTQEGYCLQMLGRVRDAQDLYAVILKSKPSDAGLAAVASMNSVVCNKDQNIFDTKKKLRTTNLDSMEHKLTSKQRSLMAVNLCLFALYTMNESCPQLCERYQKIFPSIRDDLVVIKSLYLFKNKKSKEAVETLSNYEPSDPNNLLKLKLTCVQLSLQEGDISEGCRILESLGDAIYRPGILSALMTLYNKQGEQEKASQLLRQAVDWHANNKDQKIFDVSSLWKQGAEFYLRVGEPTAAVKCLLELQRLKPDDAVTTAQLVIAFSKFDISSAKKYARNLPALDYKDVDVAAFESCSWSMGAKVNKKAISKGDPSPGSKKSPASAQTPKTKSKKKRKPKLPKNFDPNIPPDPERWLPKKERSTYRKKKDRRYRDMNTVGKGTQGVAGSSDQYDITKMASTSKSQPAVEGPRAQNRVKGRVTANKKKKGRR